MSYSLAQTDGVVVVVQWVVVCTTIYGLRCQQVCAVGREKETDSSLFVNSVELCTICVRLEEWVRQHALGLWINVEALCFAHVRFRKAGSLGGLPNPWWYCERVNSARVIIAGGSLPLAVCLNKNVMILRTCFEWFGVETRFVPVK